MSTFLLAACLVVAGAGLTLGLNAALRTRNRAVDGLYDPQAVSFAGGVIQAGYVIVLAFLIVTSWQQSMTVRTAASNEASALVAASAAASGLSADTGAPVRRLVHRYAGEVIDGEWPAMRDSGVPTADAMMDDLRRTAFGLPHSIADSDARAAVLTSLDRAAQARQQRLLAARGATPPVLYVALTFLGLLVIGYPLLLGISQRPRHWALVGAIGVVVAASATVAFALRDPFSAPLGVGSDAFAHVLLQVGAQ